jgi:hypothetical protein
MNMATAFEKLMAEYAKIKQFPMDGNLMPLADPTKAEAQPSISPQELIDEHPGPMLQPPELQEKLGHPGRSTPEIKICVDQPDDELEVYRTDDLEADWSYLVEGYWGEDTYHNGFICYTAAKTSNGTWLLDATERNACLDDITQEDIDEGEFINDDQAQAIHDFGGLEAAQSHTYSRIAAVGLGLPDGPYIAEKLYKAVVEGGGKEIIDFDPDL